MNFPADVINGLASASALGYQYLINYYNKYLVTKCRVKVRFINQAQKVVFGYLFLEHGSFPSEWIGSARQDVMQQIPYMKHKLIGDVRGGKNVKTIKDTWTCYSDLGYDKGMYNWQSSGYAGIVNPASPPSLLRHIYFGIGTCDDALFGTDTSVQVHVDMDMYAQCYERLNKAEIVL